MYKTSTFQNALEWLGAKINKATQNEKVNYYISITWTISGLLFSFLRRRNLKKTIYKRHITSDRIPIRLIVKKIEVPLLSSVEL